MADGTDPYAHGTASCLNCQGLTVIQSTFKSNYAFNAGAIYVVSSTAGVSIHNSTFRGNAAESGGGAIIAMHTPVLISGCSFTDEKVETFGAWGGAVNIWSATALTIEDTTFKGCYVASAGGAVRVFNSSALLTNITCSSCRADTYGGCLALTFSNVTVRDSRFDSNSCDFIGGAIHVDRASALYAYNSTFNNNTALYGGAINGQEPDGLVEMYGCTLTGNSASDKGGAVHVESDAFTFRAADTLFVENTVDELGGAVACTAANCSFVSCVLANNSAKLGGGVWSSSAKLLALQMADIFGNKADHGGAIYAEAGTTVNLQSARIHNNTAAADGGGLALLSAQHAVISGSSVQHNQAVVGAGILLLATPLLVLSGSNVTSNQARPRGSQASAVLADGTVAAAGSGGGFWAVQSALQLQGSSIANNTAVAGAGAYLSMCDVALADSELTGNKAQPGNGGALHANMGSSNAINATNTMFAANTASSGGAVFVTGASTGSSGYGTFNCADCTFTSNAAAQSGGAVMATGSMRLKLSSSKGANNAAAAGDGGALLCLGRCAQPCMQCIKQLHTVA
ncbi:hypothetical protein OEZ86_009196 [Tetradesmus obliquus]|nr:hypothetical protein OEZ86_009196 [Tetradesmus obliquus]